MKPGAAGYFPAARAPSSAVCAWRPTPKFGVFDQRGAFMSSLEKARLNAVDLHVCGAQARTRERIA